MGGQTFAVLRAQIMLWPVLPQTLSTAARPLTPDLPLCPSTFTLAHYCSVEVMAGKQTRHRVIETRWYLGSTWPCTKHGVQVPGRLTRTIAAIHAASQRLQPLPSTDTLHLPNKKPKPSPCSTKKFQNTPSMHPEVIYNHTRTHQHTCQHACTEAHKHGTVTSTALAQSLH